MKLCVRLTNSWLDLWSVGFSLRVIAFVLLCALTRDDLLLDDHVMTSGLLCVDDLNPSCPTTFGQCVHRPLVSAVSDFVSLALHPCI